MKLKILAIFLLPGNYNLNSREEPLRSTPGGVGKFQGTTGGDQAGIRERKSSGKGEIMDPDRGDFFCAS